MSDQIDPLYVTLLVGTACDGVKRFDVTPAELTSLNVDISNDLTTSWTHPTAGPLFCRDILVHIHNAGPSQVAYAFLAAHHDGVFRLQLNAASPPQSAITFPNPGGTWPILCGNANAKAVGVHENYLVIGRGDNYYTEQQHYGECSIPVACSGDEYRGGLESVPQSEKGVFVYSLTSGATLGDTAGFVKSNTGKGVKQLATRSITATSCWIDVAADNFGYLRYRFDAGPPPAVVQDASFAREQGVLINAVDEVSIHEIGGQRVLYASLENALTAHNLSAGGLPGPSLPGGVIYPVHAAVLAGVTETLPPHLVTSMTSADFFDLSAPLQPAKWVNGPLDTEDRANYFVDTAVGVAPVIPPGGDLPAWFYSVFDSVNDTGVEYPVAGFEIWDLGAQALEDRDVSQVSLFTKVTDFDMSSPLGTDTIKHYGGILVRGETGLQNAVYVGYGPRPGATVLGNPINAEAGAGLLIYKVRYEVDQKGEWHPLITRTDQVSAPLSGLYPGCEQRPAWISYSAATNSIYVAYGCLGVARFPLTSDYTAGTPSVRDSTVFVDGHALTRSALYAMDDGASVYTCYLGGVPSIIAKEPVSGFGTGTPGYYHTPMQPLHLVEDTTAPGAFFLADARGGIHRVLFP
ncbi:MAG: hypothetical protein HY812_18185 [Planctomycetes bacterium]|nr:hypothetical protein [Planctomycetota bacterium]